MTAAYGKCAVNVFPQLSPLCLTLTCDTTFPCKVKGLPFLTEGNRTTGIAHGLVLLARLYAKSRLITDDGPRLIFAGRHDAEQLWCGSTGEISLDHYDFRSRLVLLVEL